MATASPDSFLASLDAAWKAALAPRSVGAPTVISLFAGGGGSSLGYQMAGYREVLAVERDPHAVATLKHNFPDLSIFTGDITALSIEETLSLTGLERGELDILDGSPPCQGFSTVGKRQLHDVRNGLWQEYVRLLDGLQPRCFVLENVPGLVRGKMRLVFAACFRALQACGYQVTARVLNAAYFGVPQERHRLIMLGVRNDLGITPTHPPASTWPIPLQVALDAAQLVRQARGDDLDPVEWQTPPLSDRYGQLWDRVPVGGSAVDVLGKGFSNCVKPHPDRACCTLPSTQTGHGYATVVHPTEPRALSVLEARLICSFPPDYHLDGTYRERWARLGNAVPPLLMRAIAQHLRHSVLDVSPVQQAA